MEECLFCKIAEKIIPAAVIFENENYLAFLDLNPNTKGMTLVIPKKHFDSDLFEMRDQEIALFLQAIKKAVKILKEGLKVKRVAMVIEGMGVNHLHAKLYPLYGISDEYSENLSLKNTYFEKYQGYLSTQLGPNQSLESLIELALEITGNQE